MRGWSHKTFLNWVPSEDRDKSFPCFEKLRDKKVTAKRPLPLGHRATATSLTTLKEHLSSASCPWKYRTRLSPVFTSVKLLPGKSRACAGIIQWKKTAQPISCVENPAIPSFQTFDFIFLSCSFFKQQPFGYKVMSQFSTCSQLGDIQFTLFSEELSFADASASCTLKGQTLARISDQSEFNLVLKLLNISQNSETSTPERFWIGIKSWTKLKTNNSILGLVGDDTRGDPNKFFFVDGRRDGFEFVQAKQPGEFPWANLSGVDPEPNDFDSAEDCAK